MPAPIQGLRRRAEPSLLLLLLLASPVLADGPTVAFERKIAAAEQSLRDDEPQIAESRFREALLEGWLLSGSLHVAERDLDAAKAAFERASTAALETRRALASLALVHLQLGDADQGVALLRSVVIREPDNQEARRLLTQALVAAGRPEEAVQELEEMHGTDPEDPEDAFTLGTGYLRLGKVDDARRLFAKVFEQRPIPQTRILIGRIYRDYRYFDLARQALERALEMDPTVRRGHYYLGSVALFAAGRDGLEAAIPHFRKELEIVPRDPLASLYLGMALVESWRYEEAIPALEDAAEWNPTRIDALRFLGRCYLSLDRVPEAVTALRGALETAESQRFRNRQLASVHYQLATALRRAGAEDEAQAQFVLAEEYAAKLMDDDRNRVTRFLSASSGSEGSPEGFKLPIETALAELTPEQRDALGGKVRAGLGRIYLNLGVFHLRSRRFARAAAFFEQATDVDPDNARAWYSLGIASFNAGRFAEATEPLSRALADDPDNAELKRMLAMAHLNAEDHAEAAALLAADPERARNPSLQYAYALALVRSGRPDDAEAVFDRLLRDNADWPELHVLFGQAHAQQDDFESAVESLKRALELKADVAEANATLGVIYLRQGKLEEAEAALRAELASRPDDLRSRYNLATVLELNRKTDEARAELEMVLEDRSGFADARYLLGKILLAQGDAAEAAAHLEAAARLAPEDWNVFYQLGQAYQRLGKRELAMEQFRIYSELKKRETGE